jgi:hypothetical protein
MNIGNIISAEKLKSAAGLGVGSLVARYGANKLSGITALQGKPYTKVAVNGIPVLAGLFLSGQSNPLIKHVANGIIATSVGNILAELIDKGNAKGMFGTEVLMQGSEVLMQGETEAATYPNTSFGNAAGEMDY